MMKKCLLAIALLAACSSQSSDVVGLSGVLAAGLGLRPGIILFYDDSVRIDVPASAAIGDSVTIGVKTYGGGCVTKGETRVSRSGLAVEISPFDRVTDPGPQGACTQVLRILNHDVVLVLDRPGTVDVVIRGREWPADQEFVQRHPITVR
jgi:hypothetical protein